MAKTDTLKSIATIAEIGGDIYTKNKALDLALLQIQASRQDSQYAQEMEQKRFDFTKNQAEVANSLNQLKFAQDNRNYIAEQRRLQHAQHQKLYGVQPIYKTSASQEIAKTFGDSNEENLAIINQQIADERSKLDQLNIQGSILQSEIDHYDEFAPKYAGVNKIVQSFELDNLVKDMLEQPGFEDATGAGAREAWRREMSSAQRQQLVSAGTKDLTADAKSRAQTNHDILKTFLGEDKFWKTKSTNRKKGDPGYFDMQTVEASGKQALQIGDYQNFLNRVYLDKDLLSAFRSNQNTSALMKAIEDDNNLINTAKREASGFGSMFAPSLDASGNITTSKPSLPSGASADLEDFKIKLNALDTVGTPIKTHFDFFTALTRQNAITSPEDAEQKFKILSDNIKKVNPTINVTDEYSKYLANPENYNYKLKPKDDIFQNVETILSERESALDAVRQEQESTDNANRAFWSLYDSGDIQTRALMDNFFELTPGGFYSPQRTANENPGLRQLTNEQFKILEDEIVKTAEKMAREDAPPAYDYLLRLGSGLIPGDPFDSEVMLNKGPEKARNLISKYKEWKDSLGGKYEMSEELKKLVEKYEIKTSPSFGISTFNNPENILPRKPITAEQLGSAAETLGSEFLTAGGMALDASLAAGNTALDAILKGIPLSKEDQKAALSSLKEFQKFYDTEVEAIEALKNQVVTSPNYPLNDMVIDPTTLKTVYDSEPFVDNEDLVDISTIRTIYNSDEDYIDRSTLRPAEGYTPEYRGLRDFREAAISPGESQWEIDPFQLDSNATGFFDENYEPPLTDEEEVIYDQFMDDFNPFQETF